MASNIGKTFAVPVLRSVDLQVDAGTIHGLVGENGAGKTTLARIVVGLERADSGSLLLDEQPYSPANASESLGAGVAFCAQELSLVDDLTIAENILLHTATSALVPVRRRTAHHKAKELLALVGLESVSPGGRVGRLSLAEKQLLEVAKALSTDAKLLLLDEPTSALTGPQSGRLHDILRERANAGAAVIYISHRLGDVLDVCDRVSVLRDGKVRFTRHSDALSEDVLIREMAGVDADFDADRPSTDRDAPVHLRVKDLRTSALPHPISFHCRRGEILGLAGLADAGRTELLHAIFGLDRRLCGAVTLHAGEAATELRNARQAIRYGVGLVAEDRAKDGVFHNQSLAFNVTVAGLRRVADRMGRLNRSKETHAAADLIRELRIKSDGPDQPTRELSGGNQQKLMLARWLHCESQLLLLDEPTRGVDVAAKLAIHQELVRLRDAGVSIIVASSELEELQNLSDRILVLSNRRLVAEFRRGDWTQERILAAAFSGYAGA